jgi:hypothetical protein
MSSKKSKSLEGMLMFNLKIIAEGDLESGYNC